MDVYKIYITNLSSVKNGLTHTQRRLKLLSLLVLVSLCTSQRVNAEISSAYPEVTYNGIRYFKMTQVGKYLDEYPDQRLDLIWLGFSVNPEDETTYIAPGGDIIPRFDYALYIPNPRAYNYGEGPDPGTFPSKYSGDIYIPDYLEISQRSFGEIFLHEGDNPTVASDTIQKMYVLYYSSSAFGEDLNSLRTSVYWPVRRLEEAINLRKIQIGASYSVDYCSFYECAKLETVIFEKAPYIYEYAFAKSYNIKSIVLLSESELPFIEDANVFEDCVYKNATLYLPEELMADCDNDPVWSKFVHKKSLKECEVEIMKP